MIQIINISLIPSENKPVINVSQFDNVSRVLRFNVFDDADMETPHVFDDGDTVLLNIRKNDNNIVVITGVIVSDIDPETQEVTGQYITFELTEQACACVGSNYGEVSITSGDDEVIGSCNFKLIVERSPLSGGVSSQTAIDNLTTQIEDITEQVIGDNYYDKNEVDGLIDELEDLIPTKTSQLQNDSGYITEDDIPTIPTKTSQLQNDSGFTTIDDAATANDKTWSSEKISDELYAILPVGTASGSVASFNTALAKPLVYCVVDENATKLIQTNGNSDTAACFRGLLLGTHNYILMDTLNWTVNSYVSTAYNAVLSGVKRIFSGTKASILAMGYNTNVTVNADLLPDKSIMIANNSIVLVCRNDLYNNDKVSFVNSLANCYLIYELETPITPTITPEQFLLLCTAFGINENIYDLPLQSMPVAYAGDNNFFTDYGDTTVQYKDTIQNYIDTRVNTVSNRSLSMMRTLETLEKSEKLERGDNNDDNAR